MTIPVHSGTQEVLLWQKIILRQYLNWEDLSCFRKETAIFSLSGMEMVWGERRRQLLHLGRLRDR